MFKTKQDFIKKIHLLISICIVVPVAFFYGFNPDFQFDIQLQTIDEHNFFKAIMGIYLGFSFLWLLGLFKRNYLRMALVTNIIFMIGLGTWQSFKFLPRRQTNFWISIRHFCRTFFRMLRNLGSDQ